MREYKLWNGLLKFLQNNQKAVLFLVVDHEGSTPGKTGFKMVITEDSQLGTIGGGIMEANLIDSVQSYFQPEPAGYKRIEKLEQIHRKNVDDDKQSGLICAGQQTVVRVLVDNSDTELVSTIISYYTQEQLGRLRITPDTVELLGTADISDSRYQFTRTTNDWTYTETTGILQRVYVFGGGHVGSAISRALEPLDFFCVINDNREDLEMHQNNPYANEIRTGSYDELARNVPEGPYTYVVIATYGFPQDFQVLKEVIQKDVRYIGLMGSAAKLNQIFKDIHDLGIPKEAIEKVHAPIGIDIPNETAEEIAVSVVAELIKTKNS